MSDQTNNPVEVDTYDRGIVPAETAARKEREQGDYKHLPEKEGDIDTTGGYTVDKEGLLNNYAIEPEMYVNEPGDLRAEEEEARAARTHELEEVNETDETGKLTMEHDDRGRGPGLI
ncbi:MAG TPA: hypothetical protein V6D19_10455 [Stenomitos sp.]